MRYKTEKDDQWQKRTRKHGLILCREVCVEVTEKPKTQLKRDSMRATMLRVERGEEDCLWEHKLTANKELCLRKRQNMNRREVLSNAQRHSLQFVWKSKSSDVNRLAGTSARVTFKDVTLKLCEFNSSITRTMRKWSAVGGNTKRNNNLIKVKRATSTDTSVSFCFCR